MQEDSNRFIVIMAGGRGERLWPQSSAQKPKHLLKIVEDKPLLTGTIERALSVVPADNIFVITNKTQYEATRKAADQLPEDNIIAEPMARDTAAAAGLAKILVKRRNPQGVFAVLPADHVIHDIENFASALSAAFEAAEKEETLVTIGIQPTEPATGYGYIERGEALGLDTTKPAYKVKRFVEKPDLATARRYLEAGGYYWNGGMFIWSVSTLEAALKEHCPTLSEELTHIESELGAGKALETTLETYYPKVQKISIDYALMEKANNISMVEAAFDWDDIGEWPAVIRHNPHDHSGNVVRGEVILEDCKNSLIINDEAHLIGLVGVQDLVVIKTQKATLICPKERAQDVKALVAQIRKNENYGNLL